jgi:hypothetical protein
MEYPGRDILVKGPKIAAVYLVGRTRHSQPRTLVLLRRFPGKNATLPWDRRSQFWLANHLNFTHNFHELWAERQADGQAGRTNA